MADAMVEFVPPSAAGRRFELGTRVRLGDTGPSGLLRLDGVARILQDVATDDWEDNGIKADVLWVARRTALRCVGSSWPRYLDWVTSVTWCAGIGAAWAERRTNIYVGDELVIEAASLWVPIDHRGFPQRIPASFLDVYGEAMAGRKVSGRVRSADVPAEALCRPFPIRDADLDVIGHVNNAALWQAFAEFSPLPVSYAEIVHHAPVERYHDVQLVTTELEMWLETDGAVAVSGYVVP